MWIDAIVSNGQETREVLSGLTAPKVHQSGRHARKKSTGSVDEPDLWLRDNGRGVPEPGWIQANHQQSGLKQVNTNPYLLWTMNARRLIGSNGYRPSHRRPPESPLLMWLS